MLSRVPEVTLIFWIIKILSTTVGETAADFLAVTLNFGLDGYIYRDGHSARHRARQSAPVKAVCPGELLDGCGFNKYRRYARHRLPRR